MYQIRVTFYSFSCLDLYEQYTCAFQPNSCQQLNTSEKIWGNNRESIFGERTELSVQICGTVIDSKSNRFLYHTRKHLHRSDYR